MQRLVAGCDAVYFGLPSFGARAFANNFDLETTKRSYRKMSFVWRKSIYYDEYNII